LTKETRYSEEELKVLKDIYLRFAEIGRGLDYQKFGDFLTYIYNIENHIFYDRLFRYFDKDNDGLVEFMDIIKSLDIIEKGSFDEKVEFCFSIYDDTNNGFLDTLKLRDLFKNSFVKIIANIEKAIDLVKRFPTVNPRGFTWEEFANPKNELIRLVNESLPTVFGNFPITFFILLLDRFDYNKSLINYLETKYKFTIEKWEEFWNIYKVTKINQKSYEARKYYANELGYPSTETITLNQFKLLMCDIFKVRKKNGILNLHRSRIMNY